MGQSQGRLEDRYYLQKVKLGQGSFGTVWRAVDRQNNNVVAIKQMDKAALPRRGVRQQDIEREVNVMQAVVHENVTRLLNTYEDEKSIYLALEYCDGGDFGDKVQERGLSLMEEEAAEWMRQIVSAITALHSKHICHRDIKPDNFMVAGGTLKLADFGLALFVPRGRLLTDKCGTPAFMAPEQHKLPRHSRGYNHTCDLWAAGVTMYMLMFGGKHPFLKGTNELDDKRLLSGSLDFSVAQGFLGGLGLVGSETRFSEQARRLCKHLVEPEVKRRFTAEEAQRDPWLAGSSVQKPLGEASEPLGQQPPPAALGQPPMGRTRSTSPEGPMPVGDAAKNWWPFIAGDENARPNGQPDSRIAGHAEVGQQQRMQKKIEALEEQLRLQQEQNESQWEALVHGSKMQKQLVSEKQKQIGIAAEWQQRGGRLPATSVPEVDPSPTNAQKANKPPTLPAHLVEAVPACGKPNKVSRKANAVAAVSLDVTAAVGMTGILPAGTKCRYNSSSWSEWMDAVIQGYNESDGTYNLDIRPHARPENISPAYDATMAEAWPPGTPIYYESSTVKHWLPAIILSFNEKPSGGEGTYNLDVRDFAAVDRMRPRHL